MPEFFNESFFQGFIANLIFAILPFFKRVRSLFFFVLRILRQWKMLITGKKYILIWNDHNIELSEKLTHQLITKSSKFNFREISLAADLLKYPLRSKTTHMVILIVTDVTKFSQIQQTSQKIQLRLIKYAKSGGTLFGTHDIIYKRCRNEELQKAYGCEICNFKRINGPIDMVVEPHFADHPLLKNIPAEFQLSDGEVCWGKWSRGAKILAKSKSKFKNNTSDVLENAPTLVIRKIGKNGTLIWINSGDKNDDLPLSLSKPEFALIRIMRNAIKYNNEIKLYA